MYLYALSPNQLAAQTALADAAMAALFSQDAGKWVSLFIGLISFGAASVVVLGGARIYYSMACDGVFFGVVQLLFRSFIFESVAIGLNFRLLPPVLLG